MRGFWNFKCHSQWYIRGYDFYGACMRQGEQFGKCIHRAIFNGSQWISYSIFSFFLFFIYLFIFPWAWLCSIFLYLSLWLNIEGAYLQLIQNQGGPSSRLEDRAEVQNGLDKL